MIYLWGDFPVLPKLHTRKPLIFFWISGVRELRSYGVKELGSSDLHILKGAHPVWSPCMYLG